MSFDFFLGIDVAKQTLDYALLDQAGDLKHQAQIPNTQKAIEQLMQQLNKLFGTQPATTLVCLEHTARRPLVFTITTCWRSLPSQTTACG